MKRLILLLITLALPTLRADCVWTNTQDGLWTDYHNWSPNIVPGASDTVWITNGGNYTVYITNNSSLTATFYKMTVGGSGAPTVLVDNSATLAPVAGCVVANGGVLVANSSWMQGVVTIQAGGQFQLGAGSKMYYSLAISNQGTMTWNGGNMSVGGSAGTQFYNSGLLLLTGDNVTGYGGGSGPLLLNNSGIIRKTGGTGTSSITLSLTNQPGGLVEALSGTLAFSGSANAVAGSFQSTAPGKISLSGGTWTDAGGTFSGTGSNQFTGGTFNLRTNTPPGLLFTGGDLYVAGTNTFQQGGAITNLAIDGATLHGTNFVAGTLAFTSGSIADRLTILPSGQWLISGSANKLLYSLATLDNQGTVVSGGSVNVAGIQYLTNNGLWQFTGDYNVAWGGGASPIVVNNGTIRKTGGTGSSAFSVCYFINQAGGLLEAQSGTLALVNSATNVLGGNFTATAPGKISISGVTTDAGGACSGTGTNQFIGGTFNLRTNAIPGLLLAGGTVYITGTNTFQNAGTITNLTLDGATLAGTNQISGGALTLNSGGLTGLLTVQADGQLGFVTAGSKNISGLNLINRGTVTVGGSVAMGNTTISNGSLWQITGDYGLNYGGVGTASFTNSGVMQKTAGPGSAVNSGMNFYNQPAGLVVAAAGTVQLPAGSTNYFGTLRLNGGTLSANGTLAVAGATVEGTGTLGANAFTGGTLAPGLGGAGLMSFSSGLNLNSNATLVIDGSGPVPGTLYDQLSVTGAVVLANCILQVNALPAVPAGTSFTIIANDGADAVSGTFAGLPENAPVTVGAQTFRIHYAAGTGNDVTLVRDGLVVGPLLSVAGYTNGSESVAGSGAIPLLPFTVRASTNLVNWTNIGVVTSSVSGTWGFTDTNAWRYPRRFYNTTN